MYIPCILNSYFSIGFVNIFFLSFEIMAIIFQYSYHLSSVHEKEGTK